MINQPKALTDPQHFQSGATDQDQLRGMHNQARPHIA